MGEKQSATEDFNLSGHVVRMLAGLFLFYVVIMTCGFAFEVFPTEEPVVLAAKVTAAICGAIMLGLGGWLLHSSFARLFVLAGIPAGSFPGRLGLYFRQRVTGKTLLAGLPYLLLSFQLGYFLFSGNSWPAAGGEELQELFMVEYGIIHATLFLGCISLIPAIGRGRPVKYLLILLFGAFYAWAMLDQLSFYGYASYLFLLASKFGGYFLRPPSANQKFALFLRWGAQISTFVLILAALNNTSISGPLNILCGFWYFLLLAIYEILDVFSVKTGATGGGAMKSEE
ncbi:MAG: hypothetical protein KKG47_02165 [Proteobacteria bacterium]|nr:hypothetical protein [Pseudomonadota bacterium]MBU1737383.1 hypothetical protein [Pseudomonadota bacterium]